MAKIDEVIQLMGEIAPVRLAEDWDNVGLQVGDPSLDINNVLLALDLNAAVLEEAKAKDCGLIITHHPLIFKAINSVNTQSETGRLIMELIKNDIALFSAHTNLDIAEGGLNDFLADKLDLSKPEILSVSSEKNYYKLVVFVPESHLQKLKDSLYENGAGRIGNYSHSGFEVSGTGSFKPLADSDPFSGEKGRVNNVEEYRLETIIKAEDISKISKKMIKAHPYEEPAWDLYKLENLKDSKGIGRIAYLKEPLSLEEFIIKLKNKLALNNFKYIGSKDKMIKKVALCSGSGADFIKDAAFNGADLYLTGDLKYHEAQLAEELNLALIDFGHYGSEKFVKELLFKKLTKKAEKKSMQNINFIQSQKNTNPWKVWE